LKLEAQEQFVRIAPIGFIQTKSKSKLKCKNRKTFKNLMMNNTEIRRTAQNQKDEKKKAHLAFEEPRL